MARARRKTSTTVFVNSLRDPTKRDVYKPVRERIEAGRVANEARGLETTGATTKETLDLAFWNVLEYTPTLRYTDKDGELLPQNAPIPGFSSKRPGEVEPALRRCTA